MKRHKESAVITKILVMQRRNSFNKIKPDNNFTHYVGLCAIKIPGICRHTRTVKLKSATPVWIKLYKKHTFLFSR